MRTLKYLGAAAAVLLLAALALGWLLLRASLPRLDGALAASGLTGAVRITRDSRGVPTIEATDRADLAYASGFVHAQDRYFQMDLSRRLAAGELAELFGGVALEQDRRARLFRFRTVAREVLAQAAPAERALLEAYARGVNAGVADLAGRPWEYWVLGAPPLPWRPEDTILIEHAMWWDLQANGLRREILRQEINARLGGALCGARWKCGLSFLYPAGTSWDAPVAPAQGAVSAAEPAVPPAEVLDVRTGSAAAAVSGIVPRAPAAGSHRWAAPIVLEVKSAPAGVWLRADEAQHSCWFGAWLAQNPAATNLGLMALERATSVAEALALAPAVGIPHQNVVIGDERGHIGWTIYGRIPEDTGATRASGGAPWTTVADPPRIVDPPLGRIWTANARVASDDHQLQLIGGDVAALGAQYDLGARAGQIRDDLLALQGNLTPPAMLRIQLDDRAVFLARWRTLLLSLLDEEALHDHPRRAQFRQLIEGWNARASVDSVGYRLVRAYHERTRQAVWDMLLAGLGREAEQGAAPPAQFEGPLWQLVSAQPLHLLAKSYPGWPQFLRAQLDATIAELGASCPELAHCTWGAHNLVQIRHPLSRVLPWLASFLDMPTLELPGDHDMPRVQDGAMFGASERFAVSPGHEEQGYLQLPGGQSGHPLSPYYHAGFMQWARGTPLPFLPGPAEHTLILTPN